MGAKRARLREVGADHYQSYGALSGRSENDIRLLIDRMLAEGYIIQTEGEYRVLQMGDITRLKEEGTRVVVRKAEERKESAKSGAGKRRSTDALTGAGYRLFERLRGLRLVIAKEEAVPPYIVFNDKTLIEMCVRQPGSKQEMLAVSGVGENKFRKYGQRFLDEIAEFIAENPRAVISAAIGDEEVL